MGPEGWITRPRVRRVGPKPADEDGGRADGRSIGGRLGGVMGSSEDDECENVESLIGVRWRVVEMPGVKVSIHLVQ